MSEVPKVGTVWERAVARLQLPTIVQHHDESFSAVFVSVLACASFISDTVDVRHKRHRCISFGLERAE